MIASTGSIVSAVQVKLFGSESRLTRVLVDAGRDLYQFLPAFGGMHVDFDHTRVGSGLDMLQTIVIGRQITFHDNRNFQFGCRLFHFCQQFQIAFQMIDGRHKDMQDAITGLKTHGRADDRWFQGRRFCFGFLFEVDGIKSTPGTHALQKLMLYVACDMLRGLMMGRLLTQLIVFRKITGGFEGNHRVRGVFTRPGCR